MRITSLQLCDELRSQLHELKTDSRLITCGDVFVALPPAIPGTPDNTLKHIQMALSQQVYAIVASQYDSAAIQLAAQDANRSVYWLFTDDPRTELGNLAAARFGTENLNIPVIGITGTNGKTTCAYLLEHLYNSHGIPVGVLGTISYRWPGHDEPAPLTTPDCLRIHRSLAAMCKAGAKAVIMEVSSHSIDQKRIAGIPYSAVAFTNLTQDHLDYHKTMDAYFLAKRGLFASFPRPEKSMVINADDPYGQKLLQEFPQSLGTGIHNAAPGKQSLSAQVRRSDTDGLELTFCWNRTDGTSITWDLHSPLVGLHNASNLLTVSGLALSLGFQPEDLQCFRTFMGVPGRLERISIPTAHTPNLTGTGIFVDYAHTPDALIRVLEALKHAGFRRIITVFGCGGDRDKTKRPIMGEAVASRSDITIVTSDNPRTENPEDIINDIMPGLRNAPSMYRESDRRKAIELAVNLLQPGDALLVAGKGHENYQIIGTEKQHFSDQEILKELISC